MDKLVPVRGQYDGSWVDTLPAKRERGVDEDHLKVVKELFQGEDMQLARPSHQKPALAPLVETMEPMGMNRSQDGENRGAGSWSPEEEMEALEPPEEPGRDESQRGK